MIDISPQVRQLGTALVEGSREIVALARPGQPLELLSAEPVLRELLGYDHAALLANDLADVVHPQDLSRVRRVIDELFSATGERRSIECLLRHASGRSVPVEATAVNRLGDGLLDAVVVHVRSALPRGSGAKFSLPPAAALRRSSFLRRVEAALEAHDDFAVLAVDIENYKLLLGSFGQQIVKDLTAQAVERLRTLLPHGTAVGLLGSGEVGVLLPGLHQEEQVDRAADQIAEVLRPRYEVGNHVLKAVFAIGYVTSERDYASAEDVMTDAATAVTHARGQRGKRRARFQTQMRNDELARFTLSSALDDAIQQGDLLLHYQPIISLADGRLTGFEALARWNHRGHGMISPAQFIPLAEETGLIVPLGKWVMQEACCQMAAWHRRFPQSRPLEISVNLSPDQFQEERLLELVEGVLKQSGLRPEQLKLEITESAVHNDLESAHRAIAVLRLYGVRLALDDFGTGYSSLSYLHQLPYDTLKIDRSFVDRIGRPMDDDTARSSNAIVRAIAALARNLELDVVAEGVETPAQAAWLRSNGVEYAQGYYFAKPLEPDAAAELIGSERRFA